MTKNYISIGSEPVYRIAEPSLKDLKACRIMMRYAAGYAAFNKLDPDTAVLH